MGLGTRLSDGRRKAVPSSWVEALGIFVTCHLVGDYMVQTEWQALNKRGAFRGSWTQRRALGSHVFTYTLAFVPGLIWLTRGDRVAVARIAAGIGIPHLIQDDGTLLRKYSLAVKHADIATNPQLGAALDQSFHVFALFVTAMLTTA